MPFFYAFGARVYNPGDYTKTVLNQPKALGTLKFFQTLVDKGYVPPNPPNEDDDTALDLFGRGKVAFLSAQIGHLPVIESAVKQGLIPKPFKVSFVEFPHAKGEKPTPTASGPTLNLAHKTKDEARNKAAARLAWYLSNTEFQTHLCVSQGSFPSRKSVGTPMADNPYWVQIAGIIAKNGVCDFGITTQTFTAVRAQMFPLLSEMYMGKMTPEEVLKTYEKNVNDILAGK